MSDTFIPVRDSLQRFAEATGTALRPYQLDIACAIVDSVLAARGLTFCVLMARQAGKNEVSAVVEAFLLERYATSGGQIVKASPTYVPQSVTSRLRLKGRLQGHADVKSRAGYIVELGAARCLFLSASPTANVAPSGPTCTSCDSGTPAPRATLHVDAEPASFAPVSAAIRGASSR